MVNNQGTLGVPSIESTALVGIAAIFWVDVCERRMAPTLMSLVEIWPLAKRNLIAALHHVAPHTSLVRLVSQPISRGAKICRSLRETVLRGHFLQG
jgi:hypothetical protein